jgi:hypothetical protein
MKHEKAVWDGDNSDKAIFVLWFGKREQPVAFSSSSSRRSSNPIFILNFSMLVLLASEVNFVSQIEMLMHWGWWITMCEYAGKVYAVKGVLHDNHMDMWYAKRHIAVEIDFNERLVKVNGMFRHKECIRFRVCGEPFVNFIYSMCA